MGGPGRRRMPEQRRIHVEKECRAVVGGAADHHPVHPCGEMRAGLVQRLDPTVDRQVHLGEGALHLVHERIVERRDVAVFLRAQPLQPGLAGVDRHPRDPRRLESVEKGGQDVTRLLIVDPDPTFHRDLGRCRRGAHRRDAIGDEPGRLHQHRAEGSRLHPVRRAADVEVDLAVAARLGEPGSLGELRGVGAAELQREGLFFGREVEELQRPAPHQSGRGHHLGVEQRRAAHEPVEHAAMPVGPVHHRRDAQAGGAADRALDRRVGVHCGRTGALGAWKTARHSGRALP